MHDSGGGASSGSDWSGANVRQLWDLVEEQETDAHWKLVAGWRRSAELTSVHLARVENYRNNLAAAWPPDQSPAATAYLARLDEMIGNLRETNEAAVSNYTTFAAATGALSTSRSELKKLYAEYVANEDKIQQYEQAKAATAVSPTPAATPSPSPGPSPVPSQPPVTPEQQELLNWKARSVMNQLSGTLIEAKAQIKLPAPYKPPMPRDRVDSDEVRVGSSGAAPPIPPIVVVPSAESSIGRTGVRGKSRSGIGDLPRRPTPMANGPSLVGTAPVITPTTSPIPLPIGPSAPAVNTGLIGGPTPLVPRQMISPPAASDAGDPPGTRHNRSPAGTGLVRPGAGGPPRAMLGTIPPGGVIGPIPPLGSGQPRPSHSPIQRVNPIGGVIGAQQPNGWAQGIGIGQQPGVAGTQRRRGRSANKPRPEDTWQTHEGVPPVVSPPGALSRIEPGPAIGLDR